MESKHSLTKKQVRSYLGRQTFFVFGFFVFERPDPPKQKYLQQQHVISFALRGRHIEFVNSYKKIFVAFGNKLSSFRTFKNGVEDGKRDVTAFSPCLALRARASKQP